MNELRQKHPPTRENSESILTAYYGTLESLAGELEAEDTKQRIRTYSETGVDELIYAARALGAIARTVTVIHGPSGCGAAKLEDYLRNGSSPWIITNVDENDSILGGDDKLRGAIEDAYRFYRPEIIFVLATPVIAINNDDILSVVTELGDILEIPVVPVFAAGFKSKAAVYGNDLTYHAIAKYLLPKHASPPSGFINLIGSSGKASGHVLYDLQQAGIRVNNLTNKVEPAALSLAVHARGSIALDPDASHYLLKVLVTVYGASVPSWGHSAPIGWRNTEQWLLAAGAASGSGEEAVQAYADQAKADLGPLLESKPLNGVRVFLDLPPDQAFGIAELICELGGEPAAIAVSHIGKQQAERVHSLQNRWAKVPVLVQQGQPFEKVNVLKKLKPDLYIGGSEHAVWAAKSGIPTLSTDGLDLYGFDGVRVLAKFAAKALRNTALSRYLSTGGGTPAYYESWLNKTTNWHIKVEVK